MAWVRQTRIRPLALAAVLVWCVAAWLVHDVAAPTHGRGFEERRWVAEECSAPPAMAATPVREPALIAWREELATAVGLRPEAECVEWRSHFVARHRTELRLAVDTPSSFVMTMDDTEQRYEGGNPQARTLVVDLAEGLHAFTLRTLEPVASRGLRVTWSDRRERRMWGDAPIDLDDWQRAGSGPTVPRRSPWRVLVVLALVVLGAGLRALDSPRWDPRRFHASTWVAFASFALALAYLAPRAVAAAVSFDELAYTKAGAHDVGNVLLLDLSAHAFRWNMEHVPLAKWVFGVGDLLGGFGGARLTAAIAGALSIALVGKAASIVASTRAGIAASAFLFVTPPFIGLAHTCTLDVMVAAVASAVLVVLASLVRPLVSLGVVSAPSPWSRSDALTLLGWLLVLGVGTRATAIWHAVPAAYVVYVIAYPAGRPAGTPARDVARRLVSVASPMLHAMVVAGAVLLFLWPWLWPNPVLQFSRSFVHFAGYHPQEVYAGSFQRLPIWYFAHAFLATTPDALTALGIATIASLWHRSRLLATLLLVSCLAPFGQSLSHVRQDLARYVVSAWPALAWTGGVGIGLLASLGPSLFTRAAVAPRALRSSTALALFALVVAQGAIGLAQTEPYARLYFAAWTGGLRHVARERLFELADWCEGQSEATAWVTEHAPAGGSVVFANSCRDLHPRLRDDLEEIPEGEWMVRALIAYELGAPRPLCVAAHEVVLAGVTIARVDRCVTIPNAFDVRSEPLDATLSPAP